MSTGTLADKLTKQRVLKDACDILNAARQRVEPCSRNVATDWASYSHKDWMAIVLLIHAAGHIHDAAHGRMCKVQTYNSQLLWDSL